MPTIPKVPARVRAYLADFGATAVAITERGKIKITADPSGCHAAWWLAAKDAQRLKAECKARGDVEACARRLQIKITPHEVALMKADAALAKLDRILAELKQRGDMKRSIARTRRSALPLAGTSCPTASPSSAYAGSFPTASLPVLAATRSSWPCRACSRR